MKDCRWPEVGKIKPTGQGEVFRNPKIDKFWAALHRNLPLLTPFPVARKIRTRYVGVRPDFEKVLYPVLFYC